MIRVIGLTCLLSILCLPASDDKRPSFGYDVARKHEIKPHRRTIPLNGVHPGLNQLRLTLIVSPEGEVQDAKATGDERKFWPQLEAEVRQWKFKPFEEDGKAVTAEIEEWIDLVPPERLPATHVTPPTLHPDSEVTVTLQRSGCYGFCPPYIVTVNTSGSITFEGSGYVVARGKHTAKTNADDVRRLARKFIAADFYSMDASYGMSGTDAPTYQLSIVIDGNKKEVEDNDGQRVGMPAVIRDLENEVDAFARTERWIEGREGLVQALQAEKFNFRTFDAQILLKEAANRGESSTVRQLLDAGVPLKPLPAPKPQKPYISSVPLEGVWLSAASYHPETLKVLMEAGASSDDQNDKDLALAGAARSGDVGSVRALIAYGADPNADLRRRISGPDNLLMAATESGNPAMVREILRYHPKLEMRDQGGRTALFFPGEEPFAVERRSGHKAGARVECLRLLVEAGADVNARDNTGNTPLHYGLHIDVLEELLKLGADVNARNKEGETPIFTKVSEKAVALFIAHGADLTVRNKKGQTALEADEHRWPAKEKILSEATEKLKKR